MTGVRRQLACALVIFSASAQAANYRFGQAQDRVVSDEPQGYTQHVSPDFEVQDGIAVIYARLDHERVARLVATDYAARVYTDVAPLDAPDGKISAGDAWVANAAAKGVLPAQSTTPADRLLLSSARRLLYESMQQSTWFAHDHLGSITVETDGQGAVIGRRDYTPFGQVASSAGDADRYGFTGQESDATGMLHFRFRELDPVTGRWTSPDPLFETSSAENLAQLGEATTAYAYVANNPGSHVDPTGLGVLHAIKKFFGFGEKEKKPSSEGKQGKPSREKIARRTGADKGLERVGHELVASARQLREYIRKIESGKYNLDDKFHEAVAMDVRGDFHLRQQAAAFAKEGRFGGYSEHELTSHELAHSAEHLRAIANASDDLGRQFLDRVVHLESEQEHHP